MSDKPGNEALPTLELLIQLQNPRLFTGAQVAVTRDPELPVLNTLDLLIQNPSDNPVVEFENPEGLTPADPLPPINGSFGPRLDRLYVYFPYGTTAGTLASKELAAAFTLSPAADNTQWDISPMSDPTIGPYWLLFPKNEYVMQPTQSVTFVFTGVQTLNPPLSATHLRLKKQITGYAVETDRKTQLSLLDALPQIDSFTASEDNVAAGTTLGLSWQTWNATSTTLDPGNQRGLPPNVSDRQQRPLGTTTFALQAVSPSVQKGEKLLQVTVLPAVANSFTADPPEGSRIGEAVTLAYTTGSAVTVEITPDVGRVCDNADGCNVGERVVHPTVRTVYTLTASGANNKSTKTVTVFPLPVGWLEVTGSAPWQTREKPVLLAFGGQLFFMAGGTSSPSNPIYSSDGGSSWAQRVADAPWGQRTYAGGAVFSPQGQTRMWLLGGVDGQGTVFHDVWATDQNDGKGWTQVSDGAPWAARSGFGCIVYQNKLWVIGGRGADGEQLRDVWNTADGETWVEVNEQAPFSPCSNFALAVFSDRLWVFGGQTGSTANDVSNQIWYSADGNFWTKAPAPQWQPRSLANAQVSGEALYLFGGAKGETNAFDDLWQLTIRIEHQVEKFIWNQMPTKPQGNSAALASTIMAGGIWLAGGWSALSGVRAPNKRVWLFAP